MRPVIYEPDFTNPVSRMEATQRETSRLPT
jgi:hypothetical protein